MSRSPVGGRAMSNADFMEVCRFAGLPPYRALELLTFIDRQLGYSLTKREEPARVSRCPTCGADGVPSGTLTNGCQTYSCNAGHGAWSEPSRYQRLVPGWGSPATWTEHERQQATAPTGDDPYRHVPEPPTDGRTSAK